MTQKDLNRMMGQPHAALEGEGGGSSSSKFEILPLTVNTDNKYLEIVYDDKNQLLTVDGNVVENTQNLVGTEEEIKAIINAAQNNIAFKIKFSKEIKLSNIVHATDIGKDFTLSMATCDMRDLDTDFEKTPKNVIIQSIEHTRTEEAGQYDEFNSAILDLAPIFGDRPETRTRMVIYFTSFESSLPLPEYNDVHSSIVFHCDPYVISAKWYNEINNTAVDSYLGFLNGAFVGSYS